MTVQNVLATNLDLAAFELSSIGFGDRFFAVPPGSQHYERTETLTMGGFKFQVQIEAGLNLATRTVYATFKSINPTNGLPPPVEIGFLPPENGTGRGQGHLSYTIRPRTNLVTGTAIRNIASIIFDQQPAIGTDWVDPHDVSKGIDTNKQALVTMDAGLPTSAVLAIAGNATNAVFTVSWAGSDVGAGIAGYDVFVQTNGGAWSLWLANSPATSAVFPGQNGRQYCFYSVARDGVGYVQTNPPTVVCTQTLSNYPPALAGVADQLAVVGGQLTLTNLAYDPDGPITFSLGTVAPAGATISTNGIFRWTPACAQGSTTNLVQVWATDSGTPIMSNSVTFVVVVPECIEASVGNTVLLTGQTSSVPVRLLSTTALTNMVFRVAYPAERFTNFTIAVNSPQVLTQRLRLLAPGSLEVSFTLPATSVLHGPMTVGQLGFTARSNQSSAFVPLPITDVLGLKPDGGLAANAYGQPGRVVVIGAQSLLEAIQSADSRPLLVLYGQPGCSYALQYATNLSVAPGWHHGWQVTLTNLFQVFEVITSGQPAVFYRAYEF